MVDADGTIYAAEGSNRVQKLDPAGSFLGSYELGCQPRFMALNGEWLEIGCGSKLLSINNKTGSTQFSLVADDALPLQNPQGLAYGPDGTLYVADNGMLIAYKVAH